MKLNQTAVLIPFLALFAISCGNKKPESKTEPANSKQAPFVLVANPKHYSFNSGLQITGTANPNQLVRLYAMTSGFLHQLRADIGDFVKEGQVIAILHNPELFSSKEKIEAELKGKKSIYERLKSIYEKTPQLTTIADVEKAQAEYETTQAQLNGLLLQISYLNVKAPFSGVITNRYVDKGAMIQSGLTNASAMALFELQDLQPIRLEVSIPETDAALIDKNTKAEITFPELPDAKYTARVSRVAYGLDANTKTMKIEIDIPNNNLKIRPGMYAKLEIKRSGHKDALSVPNEAIGNIKGQSSIYVVQDGKVKKIAIKEGIKDAAFTELLDAPVTTSDQVVVQGKEFCYDGAVVNVKEQSSKN